MHRYPRLCLLTTLYLLIATTGASPAAAESDPCVVEDDGTGTVELPPPDCGYLSPDEVHMIINGLPAGTEIKLSPLHMNFICLQGGGGCGEPGGKLGGEVELFSSIIKLELVGAGELADFRRNLRVPLTVETHTGPRNPGDPVQTFDTEMVKLQGSLVGDPDFDLLTIVAGADFGLPLNPGITTLTRLGPPGSDFQVDSFFDITYRIDFVGAPGSILEGLSGSTTPLTPIRMEAKAGKQDSREPDCGGGVVELPPPGSQYVSPTDLHMMIDGLPPGTTIELDPSHRFFLCPGPTCGVPGGALGGQVETFTSVIDLEMTGTGALAGFNRFIQMPLAVQTHTGPRNPSDPVQDFATDMFQLQGQIFGDPDFNELSIVGGTGFGLPSPGHTTLTDLGDGTFQVDSFFDISYQITFIGAPGSILEGFSGTTTDTVRMTACADPLCPSVVELGNTNFTSDQTVQSSGMIRTSGTLDTDADVDLVARKFVALGNGTVLDVAPTKLLSVGTDGSLSCPF